MSDRKVSEHNDTDTTLFTQIDALQQEFGKNNWQCYIQRTSCWTVFIFHLCQQSADTTQQGDPEVMMMLKSKI